jgi:hypothetical protein
MRKLFLPLLLLLVCVFATQAQVKVLTEETFGEKNYDTDGSLKPMGFNKHWNYSEVTTFTSVNGNIIAGSDSSVRIVAYDNTNVYPKNYPNPSKGDYILLTNNSGYNGSWDTVIMANIDIAKYMVKQIEFGYVVSRRFISVQNHASINAKYRIDGGNWIQLDTTLINNDTLNRSKWQYVTLPVGKTGSKMDILIYGLTTEQIFIDDIRTIGMKLPQLTTEETFGEKNYDTDGSLKPMGFNKHWNYTEVTTFTSTNGKIMGGQDSSVRIVAYDATNAYPGNYPKPSKGDYILLTNNSGYNGSWDTLIYSNIDIYGRIVDSINFGYVVSRRFISIQNHASINAKYRIDGGKWIQLDTSLINNDTLNRSKWQYVKLPVGKTGAKLDVLIYGLTTEQIFIDDIRIITSDGPSDIAKETFGEKNYDTDGSLKPMGFNKHWNYTEVTTFTSTNGKIMGGQDSSVRIVAYDATNTYPASYPNPSKGDYILLTNNSGYNGSWDTVIYSNINVANNRVSAIEFGYVVSRRFIGIQNHAALNVKFRVDSGSWMQLDTSVINKDTLLRSKWQYVVLKTDILNAKSLDVMFYGLTTEQVFVDDITIRGYGPLVEKDVKVTEIAITGEGGVTKVTSIDGLQMIATITPDSALNKNVRWKLIKNTGGAEIDQNTGKLKPYVNSNGTVSVIALALDGSNVSDTLEVTIDLPAILISKITVTSIDSSTTITSADARLLMVPIIEPANATNKNVTWSITNGTGQATIFQGSKVKPVANGTITVTATANDGSGVKGTFDITIDMPVIPSVENIANSSFNIYPNPAYDMITISNSSAIQQLDIFSIEGRLIKSVNNMSELSSINLAGMNSGIYTIRITTNNNEVLVSKLVKR